MNKRRRLELSDLIQRICSIECDLRSIKADEEYCLANRPENLQGSYQCELMEDAISYMDDALDSIGEFKENIGNAIST